MIPDQEPYFHGHCKDMYRSSASLSPTLGNAARSAISSVWIIVGSSRGIGLEFVRQLLARGDRVYAVIRDPANASQLWALAGAAPMANCELLECDVADEASIIVRETMSSILSLHLTRSRDSPRKSQPGETWIESTMLLSMLGSSDIRTYVIDLALKLVY